MQLYKSTKCVSQWNSSWVWSVLPALYGCTLQDNMTLSPVHIDQHETIIFWASVDRCPTHWHSSNSMYCCQHQTRVGLGVRIPTCCCRISQNICMCAVEGMVVAWAGVVKCYCPSLPCLPLLLSLTPSPPLPFSSLTYPHSLVGRWDCNLMESDSLLITVRYVAFHSPFPLSHLNIIQH